MAELEVSNGINKDPDVSVLANRLHQELKKLVEQQKQTGREIKTLKKTVAGLVTLFGRDVVDTELLQLLDLGHCKRHSGLTEQCRFVLTSSEGPLTAREVCAQVQERSGSVNHHQSPIASVNVVLNRLVEYGEARLVVEGGRRKYMRSDLED